MSTVTYIQKLLITAFGEFVLLLEEMQKNMHNNKEDGWKTPILDTREVMLDGISEELDQDL